MVLSTLASHPLLKGHPWQQRESFHEIYFAVYIQAGQGFESRAG